MCTSSLPVLAMLCPLILNKQYEGNLEDFFLYHHPVKCIKHLQKNCEIKCTKMYISVVCTCSQLYIIFCLITSKFCKQQILFQHQQVQEISYIPFFCLSCVCWLSRGVASPSAFFCVEHTVNETLVMVNH